MARASQVKTKFVLVDFENIQPKDLGRLKGSPFQIKIFIGPGQRKIPIELVSAVQQLGPMAEYIQIDGSGRNALDFHIAYYIGRLSAEQQNAVFQIVSGDKGFDPLIAHLKGRGISCQRVTTISSEPSTPGASAAISRLNNPPRHSIDAVIENLRKRANAKPRTMKTLQSTIKKSILGGPVSDAAVQQILAELKDRGVEDGPGGRIQYPADF